MVNPREAVCAALLTLEMDLGQPELSRFDTEDVAVCAWKIFPNRFAWTKYPQFVDKNLVRLALTDARRYSQWVLGSHREGWALTDLGRAAGAQALAATGSMESVRRVPSDERAREVERQRLLGSDLVAKVASAPFDLTDSDFHAFLRTNPYVKQEFIRRRIDRISSTFHGDKELSDSIEAIERWWTNRTGERPDA